MRSIEKYSLLALAFLGDSYYENLVRAKLVEIESIDANRLHKLAVKYVSAKKQALFVKELIKEGFFSEEELSYIRRGKNHKIGSKARGASPVEYKWATAFEIFFGLCQVKGAGNRAQECVDRVFELDADALKFGEKNE